MPVGVFSWGGAWVAGLGRNFCHSVGGIGRRVRFEGAKKLKIGSRRSRIFDS